jgi:hypothetical protein
MISLNENDKIATGSERACYIHPHDSTKIIKIVYQQSQTTNQNTLEYKYYKELEKQGITYSHLPKCYGFVETNLGQGLVFDYIINYDGTPAPTLRNAILHKKITQDEELNLLHDLKTYVDNNQILFRDATTVNVMYTEIAPHIYRLIIIDGLGPRRENFKFFLYKYVTPYLTYKIKKQWKVFLHNVQRSKTQVLHK